MDGAQSNSLDVVNAFVSYSHDSPEHKARVLSFTQALRRQSVTAVCDQFKQGRNSPASWPRWAMQSVRDADFVLMICTETYRGRVEGDSPPDVGKGANWEGALITQELYDRYSEPVKFIPVVFVAEDREVIPLFVQGTTNYLVDPEDEATLAPLVDHLLGTDAVVPAPVTPLPGRVGQHLRSANGASLPTSWERFGSHSWTADTFDVVNHDPATEVLDLTDELAWASLRDRYANESDSALIIARVLDVARAAGAALAVIQRDYDDQDFRSEWLSGYAAAFRPPPMSTHRLHFYSAFPGDLFDLDSTKYLGFTTMRPVSSGRVGRTHLPVPGPFASTSISPTRRVVLFGKQLEVTAAPYCSVDRNVGRGCGATAAWMAYDAVTSVFGLPVRTIAEFTIDENPRAGLGSGVGSYGMTVDELRRLTSSFGLPLRVLPFDSEHGRSEIDAYLASGLPILLLTGEWGIQIAWDYRPEDGTWLVHHEELGPYQEYIAAPGSEQLSHGFVSVPEGVVLDPAATVIASAPIVQRLSDEDLEERLASRAWALRPVLVARDQFTTSLRDRGLSEAACREYVANLLPRYIWVTELVDAELAAAGMPSVLGELIFDAGSHSRDPQRVSMRVQGRMYSAGGRQLILEQDVPCWSIARSRGGMR